MKKLICIFAAVMILAGCAWAEGTGTEAWQHEAGWISFQKAVSGEELESVWQESAEAFSIRMKMPGLPLEQLKEMLLQGYSLENGVEEILAEGNRFTGKNADQVVFSHEYALVETIEEAGLMGGARIHVFRTEEPDAGQYTFLLLTDPVKTEGEGTGYVTFNLYCTGNEQYRELVTSGTAVLACPMIEKDTGTEALEFAVRRLFSVDDQ